MKRMALKKKHNNLEQEFYFVFFSSFYFQKENASLAIEMLHFHFVVNLIHIISSVCISMFIFMSKEKTITKKIFVVQNVNHQRDRTFEKSISFSPKSDVKCFQSTYRRLHFVFRNQKSNTALFI